MRSRHQFSVGRSLFPAFVGLLFLLVFPLLGMLRSEANHAGLEDRLNPASQKVLIAISLANSMRANAYAYLFTRDPEFKPRYELRKADWNHDVRSVQSIKVAGAATNAAWKDGISQMNAWVSRYGDAILRNGALAQKDALPAERLFDSSLKLLRQASQGLSDASDRQRRDVDVLRTFEITSTSALGIVCGLLALMMWKNAIALHNALESASQSAGRLEVAFKETNHRVKNNLQTIGALIDLNRQEYSDQVPCKVLDDIYQQVRTVAAVHDFLSHEHRENSVAVPAMLNQLVSLAAAPSELQAQVCSAPVELPVKEATSLALIVNELVLNAGKHGASHIKVELEQKPEHYLLRVSDDGPGLPADFCIESHANMGLNLVETLARHDLGGDLRSHNSPTMHGAEFEISFPID